MPHRFKPVRCNQEYQKMRSKWLAYHPTSRRVRKRGIAMPSKYASKLPKAVFKQDAELPYKRHWKPKPKKEICTNCAYERLYIEQYHAKCSCGGTFQTMKQ